MDEVHQFEMWQWEVEGTVARALPIVASPSGGSLAWDDNEWMIFLSCDQ